MTKVNKINSLLLYLIFSFSFVGFYVIILLLLNSGMGGLTRQVTIPVRALIGVSLIVLFLINLRNGNFSYVTKLFLLFSICYLGRVISDQLTNEHYYMEYTEIYFYYISFALVPFFSLSTYVFRETEIRIVYRSIFLTSLLFSVLSVLSYSRFIGQVERLTTSSVGEEVASPLILSYVSVLIIGVIGTYLIYNRTNFVTKILSFVIMSLSVVPFFLGGSRGSLFALFVPFIIMLVAKNSFAFRIRIALIFLVSSIGIFYLDQFFGVGLLDRFLGISAAIDEGSSSAVRLTIWENSFTQFLDNPIFGDKLRVDGWEGYPHNLFIEVLQTTGIVGFVPFMFLVLKALSSSIWIFKNRQELSWIPIIFIQAFTHNMFSGSIYTAAWFWSSMAFVLSFNVHSKYINKSYLR